MSNRKYFFDEDYFAVVDTPRKAYWLGLFYADASVSNNSYEFTLMLKRDDRYIIEMLASDVKYTGLICDFAREKWNKVYLASRINLCSKKFVAHLVEKGVIQKKTFRLIFPDCCVKNYCSHFIRGLFDGDGCISISRKGKYKQISWSIFGDKKLLESVNEIIEKEVGIVPANLRIVKNRSEIRYATVYKNGIYADVNSRLSDLVKIRDWLYKDACICLDRKRKIFESVRPLATSGLSVEEAANLIGINHSTLRKHIRQGHIASYKQGWYRRLKTEDVDNFVKIRKKD